MYAYRDLQEQEEKEDERDHLAQQEAVVRMALLVQMVLMELPANQDHQVFLAVLELKVIWALLVHKEIKDSKDLVGRLEGRGQQVNQVKLAYLEKMELLEKKEVLVHLVWVVPRDFQGPEDSQA